VQLLHDHEKNRGKFSERYLNQRRKSKMVHVKDSIEVTWRKIIQNTPERKDKPWVVFRHGTCVILMEGAASKEDATAKATAIVSEYGPVYAGTPAGDFNIIENSAVEGMIVTGWHDDVLNFVGKDEGGDNMFVKALSGRSKRDQDGRNPEVLHVEYQG